MPVALQHKKKITKRDLAKIELIQGQGNRDNGLCIMTAAAWLAGEPHTDSPACVKSVVIRRLLIALNDSCMPKPRQRLKGIAADIIGTTAEHDTRRKFMVADWAVRIVAPLALDATNKPDLAARLRAVQEIVDPATAIKARDEARVVRDATSAAYAASAAAYAASAAAADVADAAADVADAAADVADAAADVADAAAITAVGPKNKMWNAILDTAIPLVQLMCKL